MSVENETQSSQEQETTGETTTETTATETTQETETLVGGKTETETAAEEFVPLTAADITFPEDFQVDEGLRDEALAVINNRELSPKEQLQGLIDLQVKAAQTASEASSKEWSDMQKTWQDEVKADPEIGGDKLQTNLSAINKLVTEYGSAKTEEAFAFTGAGNNPEIIRFLAKVAKQLTEGGPVSGQPKNQESTAAERMFPSMKKG